MTSGLNDIWRELMLNLSAMQTIPAAILSIAHAAPDRLFVRFSKKGKEQDISFGQLVEDAQHFAAAYRARGLCAGQKAVFILPHHASQYAAYLGVMLAGGVPAFLTPFNHKLQPDIYGPRQQTLICNIQPDLIITDAAGRPDLQRFLPEWCDRVISVDDRTPRDESLNHTVLQPRPISPDDIALVQYSSGTTGARKGVALTHRMVLDQVAAYAEAIKLNDADKIISWLPLYHDMGLICSFMLPVVTGTPVFAMDALEWVAQPGLLFEAIEKFKATLCWQPNFAFNHLARSIRPDQSWDLASLRLLVNCSEPCRKTAFERFLVRFTAMGIRPEILQVSYAMAENVFAVTQTPVGQTVHSLEEMGYHKAAPNILSSGSPVRGVELKIITDDGAIAAEGESGEICLRSPFGFSRYVGRDHLALDDSGWYHTNDLGLIVQGQLFVLGRKDDMLICRGKNIMASDVEDVLSNAPGLHPGRCVCLGIYSEAAGSQDLVFVAETSLPKDQHTDLRRQIQTQIEAVCGLAPTAIYLVPLGWIVKTSSGKLDRPGNRGKLAELNNKYEVA